MPLSDHEQKLLDEMERNLYRTEADVVSTMAPLRMPNYRAIAVGVIIGLVGIITMVIGVYIDMAVVGIIGFGVLFSGVMVAVATPGPLAGGDNPSVPGSSSGAKSRPSSASFMDRINERWERRQGGDR